MPVLTIGVVREDAPGERRVSLLPDQVGTLCSAGLHVLVERGAGDGALRGDDAYSAAGARLVEYRKDDPPILAAGLLSCVGRPSPRLLTGLTAGQAVLGLLNPFGDAEFTRTLASRGVTAITLDGVPRTLSRAQPMDALTSQANVAGYKAVLVAANAFARFFPMLFTAAGTVRPARVLVLGTGVAGLQAIGTARRLGAVVSAYDLRPEARAEAASVGATVLDLDDAGPDAPGSAGVGAGDRGARRGTAAGSPASGHAGTGSTTAHSTTASSTTASSTTAGSTTAGSTTAGSTTASSAAAGSGTASTGGQGTGGYARALDADEQRRQQAALAAHVANHDIVITTAQVPGRRPPLLVEASTVGAMPAGAVLVDLACGPLGGNIAGSRSDRPVLTDNGVTIIGAGNLPAQVPVAASAAFSRNVTALLTHMLRDGELVIDLADEIQAGVVVTYDGSVVNPALADVAAPALTDGAAAPPTRSTASNHTSDDIGPDKDGVLGTEPG